MSVCVCERESVCVCERESVVCERVCECVGRVELWPRTSYVMTGKTGTLRSPTHPLFESTDSFECLSGVVVMATVDTRGCSDGIS